MVSKTLASPGDQPFRPYAWVILFIIFLASVAAPISQFKVPPVLPTLIGQYDLNMTMAGLMMSVFSFAGLILAFPAGVILAKLGQKKTVLLALLTIIAGSLWGTYAGDAGTLLATRTLEGAGMAILGVVAPVVITSWFPPHRRGLALGIWSTWVSSGVIVMLNVSPMITPPGQWAATWWLATIFAAVALVLYMLLHRNPTGSPGRDAAAKDAPPMRSMFAEALSIRDVWLISVALFSFNIMVLAMNTFYPTYLVKVHGLDMRQAGFYSSIPNFVMFLSCPLGGWLSDKTGSRKLIFSVCLGLSGLWWLAAFNVPVSGVPVLMACFGLLGGPIVTTIITALPDAVRRPALLGFGMALLQFWHHLGEFVGPVYFGSVLDHSSWAMAGYCMIPVCIIGGVAGLMMRIK